MNCSQNVSFSGRVPVIANKHIKNATAEELSSAINNIHHLFGTKPVKPSSGVSMISKNPGCFDNRTHCLTELGKDCFNKVNSKQLGVTTDSKMSDFIKAMKKFIKENSDENGVVYRSFDTLI